MMWNTLEICMTCLIPHLIAKSSSSIIVILTVWWMVLVTVSRFEWTCETDEMIFLMLVSVIITMELESDKVSSKNLFSFQK